MKPPSCEGAGGGGEGCAELPNQPMFMEVCGNIKMYVSVCVVEFELKLFVVVARRLVVYPVE